MYGDIQICAIDLDWGQALQSQTVLDKADERGGRYWYLDIISPFGTEATVPSDAPEGRYAGGSSDSQTALNAMTIQVRYKNRDLSTVSYFYAPVPGRYYVAVTGGKMENAGEKQEEYPSTLQLKITGAAG